MNFNYCSPQVIVEAWSSQCDKDCPEGTWHAIRLKQINDSDSTMVSFAASQVITGQKDFSFTFRMKVNPNDNWIWSHGWQQNGYVVVEPPRENDVWTQGPNYDHIIGGLYLGNFIAATNAMDCGFTHVLNVADNLDMVYENGSVIYKKIFMKDGAHNPIEDGKIQEAINWIAEYDKKDNKILVNCRAGIGRAGSVAVGYVFFKEGKTFEEAYDFVYKKRFVYPHAGLKQTLCKLYRKVQK